MSTLFLDTASSSPYLALCDTYQTLTRKTLPKQGEGKVIPILEGALKEVGWNYAGLTHIACITGPGGFVSLRVGVTAANTLSWALGLPSAGIHLSGLWAYRVEAEAKAERKGQSFFWLHSTRRMQLFVRGFGTYTKQYPDPTLIDLETASKLQGEYVGELLEEHREACRGCTPLEEVQPLEAVLPTFLNSLEYKKQQLLPWYGREA